MLTGIQIAGFKAFSHWTAVTIPFRPITLIFGANSSGKSSILHALALAHHVVKTGEVDVYKTGIGGDSINLGGYDQYSSGLSEAVNLRFSFAIDALKGTAALIFRSAKKLSVSVVLGKGKREEPNVTSFAISADGSRLLLMERRSDGRFYINELNREHAVFKDLVEQVSSAGGDGIEAAHVNAVVEPTVREIAGRVSGLFPRILDPRSDHEHRKGPELVLANYLREPGTQPSKQQSMLHTALRHLVNGVADAAEKEIGKFQYLGPLRSRPARHLTLGGERDSNWLAGGGHLWDEVHQNKFVRDRVNEWLGSSRLETPYKLEVRDFADMRTLQFPIEETLLNISDQGISWKGIDRNPKVSEIVDEGELFLRQIDIEPQVDRVSELTLRDIRTDRALSNHDVGIGISQILPVLAISYASKGKLIGIEQPEIHLHPALQSELGDVFLESALGDNKNTFLLETHSEHLILRILRRIRETANGELPEGMEKVRPEDVSILYVQPGYPQEVPKVLHIPVTPDGDFEQPWPKGFFADRVKELF